MKEVLQQPRAHGALLPGALWDHLRRRRGLAVLLWGMAGAWALLASGDGADAGSHEASLAAALAVRGLKVDPASVRWIGEGSPWPLGGRPAVFLAHVPDDLDDLYYAEVRLGDHGEVYGCSWVTNLTHSASAAEQPPTSLGRHLIYASRVGGRYAAVTVLDTAGEPERVTEGWPWRARFQNTLTNLQATGRGAGFGRRRYSLVTPARRLTVETRSGRFVVYADGARIVIDPTRETPLDGAERVDLRPQLKGMPGTLTWAVDSVRKLSWVGPEPIEWVEHRVFGIQDWAQRRWYALIGADAEQEADEAADDMGVTREVRRERRELSITDPRIGWPPAPITPIMHPPLRAEGEWVAVVNDPFVASYPGAPPAFFQSFLRPDAERGYARVYVCIWDPRQIQLHIMSGTAEPESATGETGPGMVPRDPETMRRLVAGFNGGFQAMHGEFGMMSEGRVYLPPKPWAATVAVYRDGQVAMGSWTDPPPGVRDYDESWAMAQIPEDMVEMRQNLTSLVEDGRVNPWERWWWGAAPVDAEEQTFIDRTGMCLTQEGFMAYFYGKSLGPEALARAMIATRCVRGMHLDMNSRHTGFEFYDVRAEGAPRPLLNRRMTSAEYEGPVPFAQGLTVRARKMIRRMSEMRFPRYVGRDGRDFFYLTIKPVLPGPPIADAPGGVGAGIFDTSGLPHAGWPHAFARAWLGGSEGRRTWLVRIDPRRVGTPAFAEAGAHRALAWLSAAASLVRSDATFALWSSRRTVGRRFGVGRPPPGADVIIAGDPLESKPEAGAALGVDGDGFIVYAERQQGATRPLVADLGLAGVATAVALPAGVRLAFALGDGAVSPDAYDRPVDAAGSVPLLADEAPAARVLFPGTEPRPYSRWWRLQDARVRYVREAPPTFSRGGGGLRDPTADAGTSPE